MLTSSNSLFAGRCVAPLAAPRCREEAETLSMDLRPDGVVVVAGRLGAAQAPAIQQVLDGVKGIVTLDCTALKYISSAGLGVLLKTQKRLMKSAGLLQLVGLNEHLRDVFQYSGVDRIFEILEPRCRSHSATVGTRFVASSYTTAAVSGSDTGT